MTLPILYADEHYVAINKPSGLLVHRSPLDKHATEFAVQQLRDQIGQAVFPCHRLDRPTSGVLLFALTREAARFANTEFSNRRVKKNYHALVRGWVNKDGRIDYDLKCETSQNKVSEAVTDYQRLQKYTVAKAVGLYSEARFSLVALSPKTGRKHQLRRHMAHLRNPIVGDTCHGDGHQNRFIREYFNCHRLLLHACQLTIAHPCRAERLSIRADYDETFTRVLAELDEPEA